MYTKCEKINEIRRNAEYIKNYEPSISFTLVTDCSIPVSVARYIDIIIPIHKEDIFPGYVKQWMTRILYNAYLPYNYSFIIDSHVFPCDKKAPKEIFTLFKQSQVDLSVSNGVPREGALMGGAVLLHKTRQTFEFWKSCFSYMRNSSIVDDQKAMIHVFATNSIFNLKYRRLSSNWFFANHGMNEKGLFEGGNMCYRGSIVITGPVRWVHRELEDCSIMNKQPFIPRCYFKSGRCNTTRKGIHAVYSEKELHDTVFPLKASQLNWKEASKRNSTSLFW